MTETKSIWLQFGDWPLDNIRKWSRGQFEGGEEFVPAFALAEANADCKRVNELLNAAIEDYNEALEKAKLHAADAKTAWAECELLRSAIRKLGVKG